MAIKNRCVNCHQVISAPEEFRGQSINCPGCGSRNRLVSADEVRGLEEREQAAEELKQRREADIEQLSEQQSGGAALLKARAPISEDVPAPVGEAQELRGSSSAAAPEARRVERLRESPRVRAANFASHLRHIYLHHSRPRFTAPS